MGPMPGPDYAQDAWVAAHGYAEQSLADAAPIGGGWSTRFSPPRWTTFPKSGSTAICMVGDDPVTLRFLIEDYLRHQRWHLEQIISG